MVDIYFLVFLLFQNRLQGLLLLIWLTFIGISQGGILRAILATIGVVLPAFVIILIVSKFMKNLLTLTPIKAFLDGIKLVISALILSTANTLFLSVILSINTISSQFNFNYKGIII